MRSPRRFRPVVLTLMLAVAALLPLAGCQTYVNIPAQTGDVASANINGGNVQNLLGEALRGLRSELLEPGKYQIILPAGATPESYDAILAIAGEPYTWANSPASSNVVDQLEIRSIRIRGLDASVDIIRSSNPGHADAPRQLVTVYLKRYVVGGWATQRVRVWRLNVQDALSRSSSEPAGQAGDSHPDDQEKPAATEGQPAAGTRPEAAPSPAPAAPEAAPVPPKADAAP